MGLKNSLQKGLPIPILSVFHIKFRNNVLNMVHLYYLTILISWEIIYKREISQRIVGVKPSLSHSSLIFLRESNFPVFLSMALYTFTSVPSPTFSKFSWSSIPNYNAHNKIINIKVVDEIPYQPQLRDCLHYK